MYCGFTEEQEIWKKIVNDFMDKEVGRDYCRKVYQEREYPYEFYDKIVKQGWLGLMIPEKYGGVESDVVMYTIMNEALAKFGVDIATSVSVSAFSAMNIVHHGTEEQKDRYLSRVVNGEIRFSISITEPNAGSDAASLATSARLDGDHFFFDANPTRKSTGTCIMRASIRGSFSTNSIVLLSISIMLSMSTFI